MEDGNKGKEGVSKGEEEKREIIEIFEGGTLGKGEGLVNWECTPPQTKQKQDPLSQRRKAWATVVLCVCVYICTPLSPFPLLQEEVPCVQGGG